MFLNGNIVALFLPISCLVDAPELAPPRWRVEELPPGLAQGRKHDRDLPEIGAVAEDELWQPLVRLAEDGRLHGQVAEGKPKSGVRNSSSNIPSTAIFRHGLEREHGIRCADKEGIHLGAVVPVGDLAARQPRATEPDTRGRWEGERPPLAADVHQYGEGGVDQERPDDLTEALGAQGPHDADLRLVVGQGELPNGLFDFSGGSVERHWAKSTSE